jgi:hypothetical protein
MSILYPSNGLMSLSEVSGFSVQVSAFVFPFLIRLRRKTRNLTPKTPLFGLCGFGFRGFFAKQSQPFLPICPFAPVLNICYMTQRIIIHK